MGVETESGTRTGLPAWGAAPLRPVQSLEELAVRHPPIGRSIARRRAARPRGVAASMRRDALFRRTLVVADLVAIAGSFLLTVALSGRELHLMWAALATVPVVLAGAKITGLYDRDEALLRKTTLDEAPKLFQLATLGVLMGWFVGGSIVTGNIDRTEAMFLWLALAAALIACRAAGRSMALRVAPVERCLFIGDEVSATVVDSKLACHGGTNAEVVAHLDLDMAESWSSDGVSKQRLAEIRDLAETLDIHRAIVAPGWKAGAESGEVLNLVRTLKAVGVRVSVLPRMLEVVGSSVEFDDLHGVTLMGVRSFDLTRSSAACKRAFDLLCTTIGLIAVAPLMALIALLVKLDGGGPVFFSQSRVGRHGRCFEMLKFRTMVPGADDMKEGLHKHNEACDGLFKIADDPRVTRVGGWLRRSALDELPQLFNVLRGEMSLVGPRPLVVDEDSRIEGWHRRRLELTPGMTGPWQILGPMRVPLREMVALDYFYIANWSLWTDVKILLRTVPHVLCRRGL